MLMARDAFGLEAATGLDLVRSRPARFAPPAAVDSLRLRPAMEFRLRQNPTPGAQVESAEDATEPFFGGLTLADAVGFIGAASRFGLVFRAVEFFSGGGTRQYLQQAAAAAEVAERPARATDAALPQERQQSDGVRDLLRNVNFKLGPVRWRAVTSTEYRLQTASGGQRSSGFVTSGNASAASYVFQPWFAQVRGGIGFVRSSVGGGEIKDNTSLSLTGDAGLSLFPASRFPFDASFSVSDSRASGEITGSDFRTTRIGVRQAYRTLDGSQYSVRYERSMISGATFGNDVLDVGEGTFSKRFGKHAVEVSGNHSSNTGGVNGTQSNLTRFIGRDSWLPSANLQVETLATYNQNAFEQTTPSLRNGFEQTTPSLRNAFSTRFIQVASFVNWRPVEGEPLFDEQHPIALTGGLRYSGIASEGGGGLTENQSASASAGVNYTIGPATRLSAGATVTLAAATAGASGVGLTTSQNATLSHAPVPKPLGSFLYSWNASVGASNSTGGGGGSGAGATPAVSSSHQSVTGQGSHTLSRVFQLAPRSGLTVSVGQSAGTNLATGGSTQHLTHNATASWSLLGESTSQAYVSLSASDSRTFGASSGDFQFVNLQATRQAPIGPLSFWTANLTLQGSRQHLESRVPGVSAIASDGFNFNTTGSVTYQHLRFLGVPRLRLFASYTANQAQLQSRALGDLNASRELVTGALDTRLDYQIGKVEARLSFRTANVDQRRNSLLFLRVTRTF